MPEDDLVDIKFRLYDGTDVGPFSYSSASTVDMLKQRVVSDWPKGKTMTPKTANEVKLMSFGKILENNKTVGQCKLPLADIGGGIIVMHVVVQPAIEKAKTGNVSITILISKNYLWLVSLISVNETLCWKKICFWSFRYLIFGWKSRS
ncbi:hypothetical protein C1H46_039241 [Malus baccata]|uniref:Ubiquitin-like domain-containing protein n=1 Tax=Malus baccata TaxID=106549 RepID=A0A540KMJ3_MALBA|nr:hypothetical protein C1H46_039241 [Malus baccata]